MEEPISRRSFLKRTTIGAGVLAAAPGTLFSALEENKNEIDKEKFIEKNVAEIKDILHKEDYECATENPYLISLLYYSNNFIIGINKRKNPKVADSIYQKVLPHITVKFKQGFIKHLEKVFEENYEKMNGLEHTPLDEFKISYENDNHPDAIDMFVEKEGVPIYALADGVVILAENGWRKDDEMSTSSNRGGNTVIIYNAYKKEFYRYAHFEKVADDIVPGVVVASGATLGTVGHSGERASREGHGKHLHLEIHPLNPDTIGNDQIMIEGLRLRIKPYIKE